MGPRDSGTTPLVAVALAGVAVACGAQPRAPRVPLAQTDAGICVLDARKLPRQREAILFRKRVSGERPVDGQGASPAPGVSPELRLAVLTSSNPPSSTPLGLAVPGDPEEGTPSLRVFELAPRLELYQIAHSVESTSPTTGRTLVTLRRRLFVLRANGTAGQPLQLPLQELESGCYAPLDEWNLIFAELDGSPPAEIVFESRHIETPCTDGPGDPQVPDVARYTAYRLDVPKAGFEPLPLSSDEIVARRAFIDAKDVSTFEHFRWQSGDVPGSSTNCP